ncbi:glycosyltransferase family 4 protein [Paenibacillus sp. MWE-103]|uniref:Glycosyltransferase family 4 protein n=1 Tax=Paenibacillus artemisiicola TaxID=1172618 RepID=A0ABS3WI83_9BACL|nr:glycosyltransferase family 4 protein [Paenibacillus artemisiicola]MBO7747806.1 glycosyltransferase family 4 protein [Paenibacillus artemisiicola]
MMKILYITHFSVNDINASSGTIYHIKRMLEKAGNEVIVIDNLKLGKYFKLYKKVEAKLSSKKTLIEREPYVLKQFSRELSKRIEDMEFDLIFAPSSLYYTFFKDKQNRPMVFYTDATFGGMVDYYIYQSDYSKKAISNGYKQETMAIRNADLIIYASDWAKQTAIDFHQADSRKCVVINRGANIKHNYSRDEVMQIIQSRKMSSGSSKCDFMFFGTDWKRKGGPIACEVVKILNQTYGVHAKLYVVGCTPDIPIDYAAYTEIVGFINKHIPVEYERLENTFKQCDFFLLPTRQEAQGISYAEACSWGMPVIAANTGGVTGIVKHGVNGFVLDSADEAHVYAGKIMEYVGDGSKYMRLAESTFDYFVDHLSWDQVGSKINDALRQII